MSTPHPHKIANGIIAIGQSYQNALPGVNILLVGLLPRDDYTSIRRDRQQDINNHLRLHCQRMDTKHVQYLTPYHRFKPNAAGHLDRSL